MHFIKFVLLMVKLYISLKVNSVRIAVMDRSVQELMKRRADIIKMLLIYKSINVLIWEYVQFELTSNERSCSRAQDRGSIFWEVDCQFRDDDFFKQNFRMNRNTFGKLCSNLSTLNRKETNFKNSICLEKRVAIALYALGSSSEYRSIANLFGVGKSTVCTLLLEFCNEVWQVLQPKYLNHFPLRRETIEDCVNGFNRIGFPQCLGALDGCHIEIHPRQEEAVDYMNYKGWYSTVLLALVDARYRFLYINVGSPGRCNDSQIFEKSNLKRELQNCSLLNTMTSKIADLDVPVVILGDSAFRFSRYLMKPFPFSLHKTAPQKAFNYQHARSRRVVENAFGQYKARFRRIGKGIDNRIHNANSIIKACCVLHNFLIEEKDQINPSWLSDQNTIDLSRSQPQFTGLHQNIPEAESIRNAFCTHFNFSEDAPLEEELDGTDGERADGGNGGDGDNGEGEGDDNSDGGDNGAEDGNSWGEDNSSCELWLSDDEV